MATTTRIYRWQDRLIRASHPSHVIAHVAQELDKPKVASQDDLEALLGQGVAVEVVKPMQTEIPAAAPSPQEQQP